MKMEALLVGRINPPNGGSAAERQAQGWFPHELPGHLPRQCRQKDQPINDIAFRFFDAMPPRALKTKRRTFVDSGQVHTVHTLKTWPVFFEAKGCLPPRQSLKR